MRTTIQPNVIGAMLLVIAAILLSIAADRAIASTDSSVPNRDESAQPQPDPPTSTSYRAPRDTRNNQPHDPDVVQWPCGTNIEVVVSLDQAPADALAIVADAVETVRAETGLRLLAPTTGIAPVDLDDLLAQTIWVGWKPVDDPLWTSQNQQGLGGYGSIKVNNEPAEIAAGYVVVRSGVGLSSQPDDPSSQQVVVLHELLHAVGVDHVADPTALMNPAPVVTEIGPADRVAINKVGCSN